MTNYTTSTVLLIFLFKIASLHCCISQNLEFTNQSEIDNFQEDYPGCTEIEGDVSIQGDDITNLIGLNAVTSIEGTLLIKENGSLPYLAGLGNLEHVENLMIINNDGLVNLTGLESLDTINGYVRIWYNDLITSLSGLDSLSFVGSDLMIEGNYALQNCKGMENLKRVGGSLVVGCIAGWMHYNRSLKSLAGFNNLSSVGGLLWINCNDSLTDLTGLESLVTIGDGLAINGNKLLASLTGLENLISCGGRIIIGGWWEDCDGNPMLASLNGIRNIDPESIMELRIRNNSSLTLCNIACICNYLLDSSATVVITENATGCNGLVEVKEACNWYGIEEDKALPLVTVHPNPCANCMVTITLTNTSPGQDIHLSCFNNLGQDVFNQQLFSSQLESIINVADWQPGIYLVVNYSEGKPIARSKFIIQ